MRTDLLKLSALLLGGALLAGGAPRLAAQDTVGPPAEPAAPAVVHSPDRVALNGDVTVRSSEVVDGRVVVMRGDLRVRGRVTGDVTVASGSLVVEPGGEVGGRATVKGGSLTNHGTIAGDAEVTGGRLVNDGRIAGEMRVESPSTGRARGGTHAEQAVRVHGGWLGSFGEGVEGVFSTLSLALVLAGLGAAAVFYGYDRLRATSEALRTDPLRSTGAGLAAGVLVLPLFLVLVFALVVTVIGIPFLLVAVPLYFLLASAALGFGLVTSAHALGERTAEQRGSLEARHRNGYTYVFTGLGILLAPVVAANLLRMTGILGWLGGLLEFFAWVVIWGAALAGTGSVLLTRFGTRRAAARPFDPIFDADPVFDLGGGGHA